MNTLTVEEIAAGGGVFEGRYAQTLALAILALQHGIERLETAPGHAHHGNCSTELCGWPIDPSRISAVEADQRDPGGNHELRVALERAERERDEAKSLQMKWLNRHSQVDSQNQYRGERIDVLTDALRKIADPLFIADREAIRRIARDALDAGAA